MLRSRPALMDATVWNKIQVQNEDLRQSQVMVLKLKQKVRNLERAQRRSAAQKCDDCGEHLDQIAELERDLKDAALMKQQCEQRLQDLQTGLEEAARSQHLLETQLAAKEQAEKADQQRIGDLEESLSAAIAQMEGLQQGVVQAGQIGQQYMERVNELQTVLEEATGREVVLQRQLQECSDAQRSAAELARLQEELLEGQNREAALEQELVAAAEEAESTKLQHSQECQQLQRDVTVATERQGVLEEHLVRAVDEQLDATAAAAEAQRQLAEQLELKDSFSERVCQLEEHLAAAVEQQKCVHQQLVNLGEQPGATEFAASTQQQQLQHKAELRQVRLECMKIVESTEECMQRAESASLLRVQEERDTAVQRASTLLALARYDLVGEEGLTGEEPSIAGPWSEDSAQIDTLKGLQNTLKLVQVSERDIL